LIRQAVLIKILTCTWSC